jgi:hypothetical protein
LRGEGSFSSRIDEVVFAVVPFGWLALTTVLSLHWWKSLNDNGPAAGSTNTATLDRNNPSSGRGPLVALAMVALVASGFFYGRDSHPRRLMHGTREASGLKLPAGATDVSLSRFGGNGLMFNFSIDEPGFWQWAKSMGHSRHPQGDDPAVLPITDPVSLLTPAEGDVQPYSDHVIHRGWFYHHMIGRRGLDYAYDADEGRAYFQNHPD